MNVITYQLAYDTARKVSLCADCERVYEYPLGAVQYGKHKGECEGSKCQPKCECGLIEGREQCWADAEVLLEYFPESVRGSHVAARNQGTYPHNGAQRVRASRACAEEIVTFETEMGGTFEWARIVEELR